MASTMVHSPKAMESMGFGSPFARRGRLSLVDAWVSLPSLRPVRTGSSVASGSFSGSAASPRRTPRALYVKSSLSPEAAAFSGEVEEEVGCETPKSTDHRIPDVDVEICPPAPKKARGMSRMALACASEWENPSVGQDLGLSPCFLF